MVRYGRRLQWHDTSTKVVRYGGSRGLIRAKQQAAPITCLGPQIPILLGSHTHLALLRSFLGLVLLYIARWPRASCRVLLLGRNAALDHPARCGRASCIISAGKKAYSLIFQSVVGEIVYLNLFQWNELLIFPIKDIYCHSWTLMGKRLQVVGVI